jgi:AAA ATPase domain
MPGARIPLVGRREEMAVLEDEFARAAAGEFRVVLLSGEAGVGKRRLCRELLARHHDAAGIRRHLDDGSLLVAATSRPADLAGQEVAAQALFELDEDGFLQRLEVSPLDRNTTQELAGTIIGQPPPAGLDLPDVTVQTVDRLERPGGMAKLKRFLPLDQAPAPLSTERWRPAAR